MEKDMMFRFVNYYKRRNNYYYIVNIGLIKGEIYEKEI